MKRVRTCLACLSAAAIAGTAAGPARAQAAPAAAAHDGRHDFDFHFGTWTTHIARRAHPFSGSDAMVHLTGTVTVRRSGTGRPSSRRSRPTGPRAIGKG